MAETKRIETADGSIIYSWMGKMHCWEGPAYIPQGNKRAAEYWLFGFKYTKDQWEDRKKDVTVWLVEQGYPKEMIDSFGEHFYCRYWEQPDGEAKQ